MAKRLPGPSLKRLIKKRINKIEFIKQGEFDAICTDYCEADDDYCFKECNDIVEELTCYKKVYANTNCQFSDFTSVEDFWDCFG